MKYSDIINDNFVGNIAVVFNGMKYNIIDRQGNLLLNEWYDAFQYLGYGVAEIRKDNKVNIIDDQGNILCDEWFDDIEHIYGTDGFLRVCNLGLFNIIDTQGNILCDEWFDNVECIFNHLDMNEPPIYENYIKLTKKQKTNFFDIVNKKVIA